MSEKPGKVKARRGKAKAVERGPAAAEIPRARWGGPANPKPDRPHKTLNGRRGVDPEVKRARIFHLAKLIAAGECTEKVQAALRAEWKLAAPTVRLMVAEASRIVDYCTNDRAKLISISRVRLAQIAAEDAPDRVQAIRTQFEHLGELRKRVEMSGPAGAAIPIGLTAKVVVLPAEDVEG